MEKVFVRLSRPILIDVVAANSSRFITVFGFLIEHDRNDKPENIESYIAYLSVMQAMANNECDFKAEYINGGTYFIEPNGEKHHCCDEWGSNQMKRYADKLNIKYSTYVLGIDYDNVKDGLFYNFVVKEETVDYLHNLAEEDYFYTSSLNRNPYII